MLGADSLLLDAFRKVSGSFDFFSFLSGVLGDFAGVGFDSLTGWSLGLDLFLARAPVS